MDSEMLLVALLLKVMLSENIPWTSSFEKGALSSRRLLLRKSLRRLYSFDTSDVLNMNCGCNVCMSCSKWLWLPKFQSETLGTLRKRSTIVRCKTLETLDLQLLPANPVCEGVGIGVG